MKMTTEQRQVFEGATTAGDWAVAAQVLAEARLNPPAPKRKRPKWRAKGLLAVANRD